MSNNVTFYHSMPLSRPMQSTFNVKPTQLNFISLFLNVSFQYKKTWMFACYATIYSTIYRFHLLKRCIPLCLYFIHSPSDITSVPIQRGVVRKSSWLYCIQVRSAVLAQGVAVDRGNVSSSSSSLWEEY